MTVRVKRIHAPPDPDDGYRVPVDRLWPRGISKREARLDAWMKDIAPSDGLRKWFNHRRDRWEKFRLAYLEELQAHREQLDALQAMAQEGDVTLLFAAKDETHNNAVVVREWLSRNPPE